jgi:hypothetical protein
MRNVTARVLPACAEFCEVDHNADTHDEWSMGGGRECVSYRAVDMVDDVDVLASPWAWHDRIDAARIVVATPGAVRTYATADAEALARGDLRKLTARETVRVDLGIADAVGLAGAPGEFWAV